jgi:hypothetical protein
MTLVRGVASRLGVTSDFRVASEFHQADKRSNERLIALVSAVDARATYLSGTGAASYQQPELFRAAGLNLEINAFAHQIYAQNDKAFVAGLSAIDAVFWLGWEGAGAMLRGTAKVQ